MGLLLLPCACFVMRTPEEMPRPGREGDKKKRRLGVSPAGRQAATYL
ncbi:hypothetical protein [Alicyclobacillus cellulosilyticus]|nr:hypothetical protein [Alicyclobacillus cellulosilyticus]